MKDKHGLLSQILLDTGRGIKGYFKAQFILMLITFIILLVGLNMLDVKFSILVALVIASVDILPAIGSGIIMIPWSILSFILGSNEIGMGIAILYVILLVSRQFIEPIVLGKNIGVRPLYTFLSTIAGSIIFGPIGILLGPLIAVVITSIFRTKNNYKGRRWSIVKQKSVKGLWIYSWNR